MKGKLTFRGLIILLTGFLFAVYAAYNIFIIFKDRESMTAEGIWISALVALLFGIFTVFLWTSAVKNVLYRKIRRRVFILALLAILVLKLRLAGRVVAVLDLSELYTLLYGFAYFMTLVGLLLLLIYYTFKKRILRHPLAAILLPLSAKILFLLCFIAEVSLFCGHDIGLEANTIRTVIIRPVFYFGLIGLSSFFLLPPDRKSRKKAQKNPAESKTADPSLLQKNNK